MAPKDEVKTVLGELVRRLNEDERRIRSVEQRSERIENSISTLEQNVLSQMGDLKISLERIGSKISLISDKMTSLESDIGRLNKELSKSATKAEIKQIETYLDIVNPLTSKFVTQDELERALEEKLGKKA